MSGSGVLFGLENVRYQSILDIQALQINPGVTVLLGASGSGKTTLLRLLNKSISPTSGMIWYSGMDLKKTPSVLHRRQVLMLSQQAAMFPGTIADNLAIGFQFQERPEPDSEAMRQMLFQVQLKKELSEPVMNLSGGEKQRLALARVFLLDPAVYLLDEPSSALDDDTADAVIGLVVQQARATGRSIVMVTHSKAVASKFADETVVVKDGRVVRETREINQEARS
ncbi:MAG: ABC transporter ATP-binding protein [Clostridia bacterium]|nr:ABC transporter ATP-binding protein [Clostridia bacterium]